MSLLSPKFVVFEGIEGAGKSTMIRYLSDLLEKRHARVTVTREPGGTLIADGIRGLLLKSVSEPMHARTELCLLAASRSQHVQEILKPAIASHHWILCDRFCDSTMAYQGYGRGIDKTIIDRMNEFVCENVRPDIVFICDIDPQLALERIHMRLRDRIESETLEFFGRVRQGYLEIAKTSKRYVLIDASKSIEDISKELCNVLGL